MKKYTLKAFIETCQTWFEKEFRNPNGKDAKETAKQMLAEIKLMAEISHACKWQVKDGTLFVKYDTRTGNGGFKIPDLHQRPTQYEQMMCEALKTANYCDNLNP